MIDCSEKDLEIVKKVILEVLPDVKVFAFGSRVNGKCGKFSDLDLALDSEMIIPLEKLAALREEFSESNLPFRVDLVDLNRVPENIRINVVNSEKIVIR